MFGLDASKKKFNKVWNQRRAASARAAKVSTTTSSNVASSSTSNSTSNVPQQRSASFRYRSEGSTRPTRTGHSSDFDDEDDDEGQFTFTRSSFARSKKASFKSQPLHNRSTGNIPLQQQTSRGERSDLTYGQSGSKSFNTERNISKLTKTPSSPTAASTCISPANRATSKDTSDLALSSVVSTSPVTCLPARYSLGYNHNHYSNYEWIDANGLVVPPPDSTELSCAPCKDVSISIFNFQPPSYLLDFTLTTSR